MNIYKSCVSLVLLLLISTETFAATRTVDDITWTNTQVTSNYSPATKAITMFVTLQDDTSPTNNYVLELRVLGRRAEEKFVYNERTNTFSAVLNVSMIDIERDSQSYSLRIKDTRKKVYYIINQSIGTNTTPTISSSLNLLTTTKQIEANIIVDNILENIPTSANTTVKQKEYLSTIALRLSAYNRTNTVNPDVISNVILQLGGQDFVIVPNTPTSKNKKSAFTPKYKSKSDEPTKINGIGNNPKYSSWRVGN